MTSLKNHPKCSYPRDLCGLALQLQHHMRAAQVQCGGWWELFARKRGARGLNACAAAAAAATAAATDVSGAAHATAMVRCRSVSFCTCMMESNTKATTVPPPQM